MAFDNSFGNGESQSEAAGAAPCLIGAVKPFEKLIQILPGDWFPFVGHCQQTVVFAAFLQGNPGGALFAGIFLRVIQQNIHHLTQFGGIPVYQCIEEGTEEEKTETFILNIGRDPAEQEKEGADEAEGEETEGEETEGEKTVTEDVKAYARIGESKIIYRITSEQYEKLMDTAYNSMRHQEIFWADFSDIYQLDITLEGETYTLTSVTKEETRTWYYQGEELEMAGIRSAVRGLKADTFTEEMPTQKEEIALTVYLEDENYPEVHIQLYRYDGQDCIAVVDGEPVALVERSYVVDLADAGALAA